MPRQLEIIFNHVPSREEICMMCHLSSGCSKCCRLCEKECNSSQICGLKDDPEDQKDRLAFWLDIISEHPEFADLEDFMFDEE